MHSYGRCDELTVSPFILMLLHEDKLSVSLYATGETALFCALDRPLPKTTELKGAITCAEIIELCRKKGYKYSVRDNSVHIISDDKRYIYSPLTDGSPENDAPGRDFTVNSIYISCKNGELCDPLDALRDLREGRLKSCADIRASFRENPSRILNMVRLSCEYDLTVSDDMMSAAKEYSKNLEHLSADTVRNFLFSLLMCDTARTYEDKDISGDKSPVLRGLYMLREMDAFAYILPELEASRNVEQKKRYHMYDVQGHMLHTCAATPPRLHMRMAGLLHDIGKPEAHKTNNGRNMHGHDKIGAMMARDALHRLGCREEFINKVCHIIAIHMYDVAGIAKDATLRKRFALWGFHLSEDLIDFRFADVAGSGCPEKKSDSGVRFREVFEAMKADNAPFSIYELKISGRDIAEILDLHSGSEINNVKRELLRICAVDPSLNEHNALLRLTEDMKNAQNADFDE